jgi:hypothetical protein
MITIGRLGVVTGRGLLACCASRAPNRTNLIGAPLVHSHKPEEATPTRCYSQSERPMAVGVTGFELRTQGLIEALSDQGLPLGD